MSLLSKLRSARAARTKAWKRKRERLDLVEAQEKEIILAALERAGVSRDSVQTNGYWFKFTLCGMRVVLVSQIDRLLGEIFQPPAGGEWAELNESIHRTHADCERHGLLEKFTREFHYESFLIDSEVVDTIEKAIEIVRKKAKDPTQ